MENLYYVGLDVHKETVEISLFRNMNHEPEFEKQLLKSEEKNISTLKRLQKERTVEVCYEAGCMGFTLHRKLTKSGISSRIVLPGKIHKKSGAKFN